ncbi:Protocadherin-19 [Plecturocebus cupreus]
MTRPRLVAPLLLNGSAQLLLPRDAPLGYLLTRLQAKDADEGANAELTYILLGSDGGPGMLALHSALQHRLSP